MKTKLSNLLSTKKRKTLAIIVSAASILSLSAFTVLAANDMNLPSLIRNDNGNVTYSTDGGNTWTAGEPDGFNSITDENGFIRSWVGEDEPPADAGNSFAIKHEDGKMIYSNDGGKTWTDEAPGNVTFGEDGSITVGQDAPNVETPANTNDRGSSLVKNENGTVSYSTDGGNTWTNRTPDGFHSVTDENGFTRSWVGSDEPPADGGAFVARYDDGKMIYSNDGGKTWTDEAPGNATFGEDGSLTIDFNNSKI